MLRVLPPYLNEEGKRSGKHDYTKDEQYAESSCAPHAAKGRTYHEEKTNHAKEYPKEDLQKGPHTE
jgi:hypothetical protein